MELICWVSIIFTVAVTNSQRTGFGKETAIPSGDRVHYQYLNHIGSGTYKFGYDTGSDGPAQLFHQEERTSDGKVKGRYGYLDQRGVLRIVAYIADETGYHVVARPFTLTPEGLPPKPVGRPYPPFVGPLPPFILRPV